MNNQEQAMNPTLSYLPISPPLRPVALAVLALTVASPGATAAGQETSADTSYGAEGIATPGECRSSQTHYQAKVKGRAMSFGGVAPDVPWFTLPAAGYGPLVLPVVGTPPTGFEPYTNPAPTQNWNADNPPSSSYTSHSNVTRYWSAPPTYTIVLPPGVTGTDQVAKSFPSTRTVLSSVGVVPVYTWNDWINDVNSTFRTYDETITAQISTTYSGTSTADWRFAAASMAVGLGTFIWPTSSATAGPTGNDTNEIILTDQPTLLGGGLTSMIVDPTTGVILEADVFFSVDLLFTLVTSNAGVTTVTTPREWTALRHEIGHFYGLDHSNLHPGLAGATPLPSNPGLGTVTAASVADFTGPATSSIPTGELIVPGMVGVITHAGLNFNMVNSPLHLDDATCLSRIYPVCMPSDPAQGGQKLPLINTSARIIGRMRNGNTVFSPPGGAAVAGKFGVNVYVHEEGTTGNAQVYPKQGVLSGMARLSDTDGAFFSRYNRPSSYPVDGLLSAVAPWPATQLFSGNSVVGASTVLPALVPLAPQPVLTATGDFSLDGLPPGSMEEAVAYEVVFEDSASLGVLAANQADWFNEPGFYTGNPLDPYAPVAAVLRSIASEDLGFSRLQSQMRTVPGTVIALDPVDHDETSLSGVGVPGAFPPFPDLAPFVAITGAPCNLTRDFYARPLISIEPRTGRYGNPPVEIRILDTFDMSGPNPFFSIDPANTFIYINDVVIGDLITIFGSGSFDSGILPGITYAGSTAQDVRLSIPMASILAHEAASKSNPHCPPGGINPVKVTVISQFQAAVPSYDRFIGQGRNDCIF